MSKIVVVGLIASKNGITLFQNNGESLVLSASNYETADVGKAVAAGIGENGSVEIELEDFLIDAKLEAHGIKIERKDGEVAAIVKSDTGEEKRVVVGDNLDAALYEVAYGDGAKGFKAFLAKFSEQSCPHTSKDILAYMKANDLPIADDGSIIVYKILRKTDKEGVFVDPRTRKVTQRIGSIVTQDEKILDKSTRNLCSTGLHVCYNAYVSGFSGDVLTLCKVEPKDVIAKGQGEAKMRVAAYQICALLPDCSYQEIENGKTAAATEGRKTLIDVIEGRHPPAHERVIIRGAEGADLDIVPIGENDLDKTSPAPPSDKPKRERRFAAEVKKVANAISVSSIKLAELFGRKKPPVAGPDDPYEKRLNRALYLIVKQGKSIREVAPALRMDRESLGKKVLEAREAIA